MVMLKIRIQFSFLMKKLFIPASNLEPISQHFNELLSKLESFERVGLTSTVQFKHRVKEVKELLKAHEVIITPTVLGCNVQPLEVDCSVIIATGTFHAVKLGLVTGKPVFILNPGGVNQLNDELIRDFERKQSIRVAKVINSRIIGVLVSTKSGQSHEQLSKRVVKELRDDNKEAYLFVADELSPAQLNDFPVDAWINTACPRLVEDDFDKPIANWSEVKGHLLNSS